MSTQAEKVQHGLKSWVDHDRPWLFQRQFLVSEYRASIISNFVSIILTLTGPRLWILIKAFILWTYYTILEFRERRRVGDRARGGSSILSLLPWFRRTRQSESLYSLASQPPSVPFNPHGQASLGSQNFALTEESHSELGAARDLLRNVWRELQSDGIQLPETGISPSSRTRTDNLRRFWTMFQRRARRVSNIFLQNVVDIVFSLLLSIIFVAVFVAESTGGIFSVNIVSDSVALANPLKCGIYMAKDWPESFSRSATALQYRDQCYKPGALTEGCDYFYRSTLPYIEIQNDECPFKEPSSCWGSMAYTLDTGLLDIKDLGINTENKLQFRRKTTCAPNERWPGDRNANCSENPPRMFWNGYGCGRNDYGRLHSIHPGSIFWVQILMNCVFYTTPRDDPMFPASGPYKDGRQMYTSNIISTSLVCLDIAQICNPVSKICRDHEIHWNSDYRQQNYRNFSWPVQSSVTDIDRALALLSYALYFSSTLEAFTGAGFEVISKVQFARGSPLNLPKEQWKVEIRRWFEYSLARMQVEVLDLVQSSGSLEPEHDISSPGYRSPRIVYDDVLPPEYKKMCDMVKFRSNGWRNVSTWGLFGVLFLVLGISLGSVTNGGKELWLVIATRLVFRCFGWLCGKGKQVLSRLVLFIAPRLAFGYFMGLWRRGKQILLRAMR